MLSARLVLVRHGQSTYNAQARLQGQADPPLSDAGRAEAVALRASCRASSRSRRAISCGRARPLRCSATRTRARCALA